jgi:hypothetical protein
MATYYVNSSAGGGGNGSSGTPWNHPNNVSGLVGGDVVNIAGTFTGPMTLNASGTSNNPIRWQGYTASPGDGGSFTISGGSLGLGVGTNTGVAISNMAIQNIAGSATINSGSGELLIYNATISKGSGTSNAVEAGLGTPHFHKVTFNNVGYSGPYACFLGCTFNNAPGWAIACSAYRYVNYVIGCRFKSPVSGGIQVPDNGQCPMIIGNSFYNASGPAIEINAVQTTVNFQIFNNLFWNNTKSISIPPSAARVWAQRNAFYSTGAQDTAKMLYWGNNDITLSALPVDDVSVSWAPNNLAGGGALIRNAGFWGNDIGAGQAVPSGGSSAVFSGFHLGGL